MPIAEEVGERVPVVAVGRPALSDRQEQILRLVVSGWTQPRIAAFLCLSCRTVEDALAAARSKYEVPTTAALVGVWVSTSSIGTKKP